MAVIGLVGHCGPDGYMLRSAVKYAVKDADVRMINNQSALDAAVDEGIDLLLINRVLDGSFTHHQGLGVVSELRSRGVPTRTMIISNYPDAQDAALKAGALRGFGKSEVGSAKMRDALTQALSLDRTEQGA